ncbi:MAG: hypothetical protein ACD_46C00087G0004 [uncultured bacterium]|nr:MAG: hypothetical protein ACD_46C00087G0004 [uncultured bacterium]
MTSLNSYKTLNQLNVNGTHFDYFSLPALEKTGLTGIAKLPHSLKILLENLLRHEDNSTVTREDIEAIHQWLVTKKSDREIAYRPARVLMQDFTGVPAVVDLAAMRDAIKKMGGNPKLINPLSPVDLVIDHSIQVDDFANTNAIHVNAHLEMERNNERYVFLRWGQTSFDNFRVVPPDTGICHQVNLEYLAKTVWHEQKNGKQTAYPDTLVGTDSHTTMINGLGVLGWGVGGIEAEAAMLGQPISMLIPEVIGVRLTGKLCEGVTATDLVLTLTELLRKKGVVGKFVEYFGPGLADLPVADRATIANMAPEYGATCGFFPIDQLTIDYLRLTGRDANTIALVEAYAKAQDMWYEKNSAEPEFTDTIHLDLSQVEPSLAGPKRPQDRVQLANLKNVFNKLLVDSNKTEQQSMAFNTDDGFDLHHGDVVIAAITSCTNTSNPSVLMAAGLVAKKALEKGLQRKPWVKSSLAPGSQVVTQYLLASGLQTYLDQLGFNLVGYGCTTCIGNSGPLPDAIAKTISEFDLIASAVLSGNRNFEGRIHPHVKANWLASPPLVVIFALTGTTNIDLTIEPVGQDKNGNSVYLKDLWPSNAEVAEEVAKVSSKMFSEQYSDVFAGNKEWKSMNVPLGETYTWQNDSTYIQLPPFFTDMKMQLNHIQNIENARILALLGDSITTDHISPAGSIKTDSPAGKYLQAKGVAVKDFNSYGARRGNHEVMMRGTFANIRIRNEMVPGVEGGFTKHYPSNDVMSIYDAAMKYKDENIALVIIAGKEYGTGSSRDWAAKGPKLQGVQAVIAESFERIHRSNLIGMGILPLQFKDGMTRKSLELDGTEIISIINLNDDMKPSDDVKVIIKKQNGSEKEITTQSRIDTQNEIEYYRNGGILQYVLRRMLK